jgi:phospholipase C
MTTRPVVVLALAALVAALIAPASAGAAAGHQARTPIKHFIVLMQENHTYDNYFGTYPRGDGIPPGVCMPINVSSRSSGCVRPFHIGALPVHDLGHNPATFRAQYNGGRMNGFVNVFRSRGFRGSRAAMGYYNGSDIPYYWNLADHYVLFDHWFSAGAGGSVYNHMYWVTGTEGSPHDTIPPRGFGNIPTIFDRLEQAGVSWKFYVQNYDPSITYRSRQNTDRGSQIDSVPLLDYARYIDNPKLFHIVDADQYYTDLRDGTLPSVAFMAPSGSSEHPPGSIQAGERFVRTLIGALTFSRYWSSSAFMWSYADWGGWYDHVKPPHRDRYGDGFRVPTMLVSAYARPGFIDHTVLDHTSFLKFIDQNWNLRPLAARDAHANDFMNAFDFSRPPSPAVIVSDVRGARTPPPPKPFIIYPAYGLAFGLTVLLILWPVLAGLLRRRRAAPAPSESAGDSG